MVISIIKSVPKDQIQLKILGNEWESKICDAKGTSIITVGGKNDDTNEWMLFESFSKLFYELFLIPWWTLLLLSMIFCTFNV